MTFLDIFSKSKSNEKQKIKIIIDNREKNSLVASELVKMGFNIEFKQLSIGDYVIKNTVIERKTISDFKSSLIDKRIFYQIEELKQYNEAIIILEGIDSEKLYDSNKLHENALRGIILSIAFNYSIPLIFTFNEKDTAKYICVLANKNKNEKEISLRASKIFLSKYEQAQFILEGFPNIGPVTARKLLEKFKTIKNIINATEEELKSLIGKRYEEFYKLLNEEHKK